MAGIKSRIRTVSDFPDWLASVFQYEVLQQSDTQEPVSALTTL